MVTETRALAIVTGASTGIGYELAKICAQEGMDLVVVANEDRIQSAAKDFEAFGSTVTPVNADLALQEQIDRLLNATRGRQVTYLLANAGEGLGQSFLDQDFGDISHIIDTNVVGTLYLIHRVARSMRENGSGRILITGSIAGFMPGPFNAVYNASKAFIDSFSWALRNELQDTGISVTCLMPGATETEFFERAGLMNTKIGQSKKADPAEVARIGFDAMMNGDGDVVAGWYNKVQSAIANITPASVLAGQHRKMAEPHSGNRQRASR